MGAVVGEPSQAVLHVTNGESAAGRLRRTRLGGFVLAWNDALHEGPLALLPANRLRPLRARFLAEHGWGDEAAIAAELARRDELLDGAARERRPIALWFEHDLYDQLQLIQVLDALAGAAGPVELIQSPDFLGAPAALEELWERRAPVTPAQTALAQRAWRAVRAGALDDLDAVDCSPLPFLSAALARLREERAPRSRTARQLLAALADGPLSPPQLFAASQAAEEAPFLGDTWCFQRLAELADEGLVAPLDGPMPAAPPRGDHARFAALRLELTPAGAAAAG